MSNASVLSRTILALNALILVTTFILALASTDAQGEIALASGRAPGRVVQEQSSATDFLRLVGSMEGLLPATALDSLTPEQLRTVQDALEQYRRVVGARLSDVLYSEPGPVSARQRLADISK